MNDFAQLINLDRLAASRAQDIVTKITNQLKRSATSADNMATKALGVLQENGIYAAALFLTSRKGEEKDVANIVMDEMLNLIEELNRELNFGWARRPWQLKSEEILTYLNEVVSEKIERLLLAKESLEKMLIYARYGAKARTAEGKEEISI